MLLGVRDQFPSLLGRVFLLRLVVAARYEHLCAVCGQARSCDDESPESAFACVRDEFDGIQVVAGYASIEDDHIDVFEKLIELRIKLLECYRADGADLEVLEKLALVAAPSSE